MSIQPSSRFNPSTFGTFLMLVRNILLPSDADVMPVVALTAFASAAPIISLLLVMIVLQKLVRQNLAHQAGDTPRVPPRNRCRRYRARGRHSSSRWQRRQAVSGCRVAARD